MSEIPFRSLATAPTSLRLSENFDIRSIEQVLGGSDVVQALHRHDHYFLLVLTTGEGVHECDFRPHALAPHTIYAMRPGQVHRLVLKAGSAGYILQFKADFLATSEPGARLVREVRSRRRAPEACLPVGRLLPEGQQFIAQLVAVQ